MSKAIKAGILTDVTRCIGCEQCVEACTRANGLGQDPPYRWLAGDGLSANRLTTVIRRPAGKFVRKQCMHCLRPACVSACPVGALYSTPEGAVAYHADRCMGCRYCMLSCPFAIPRYTWDQAVPHVRKCHLDLDRVRQGKQPACTEACPTGATIFGSRDKLLAEARQRIRAHPGRYKDRIFGEHEVGGTAILTIAGVDLGFLGWRPDLGQQPLDQLTWSALRLVPQVFVGVGALMGGLHWVISRRQRLAAEADPDGGGEQGS